MITVYDSAELISITVKQIVDVFIKSNSIYVVLNLQFISFSLEYSKQFLSLFLLFWWLFHYLYYEIYLLSDLCDEKQ